MNMNKKTIVYFSFALAFAFTGNCIHYTRCIHPRMNSFELTNFIAHSLIYGSLIFVFLIIKNTRIKQVTVKSEEEIIIAAKSYCDGTTLKEVNFMIVVTKLFSKISDQRFVIVFNALISLVLGFGLFTVTGNWLIIPISILIQFLITKYWIIPLWGNEIDEKKRELKIELMVFEESKKNNLSNKKAQ